MSSQPGAAHVLFSAPLGCPCLIGGGQGGDGVQMLCFTHKKYQMIWERLNEAVRKFSWGCC